MINDKIIFITSSRSDLDLITVLVKKFKAENYNVNLIICGSHLYKNFGQTYKDVDNDVKKISYKIKTNIIFNKKKSQTSIIRKFNNFLSKKEFKYGIILGDRIESYLFSLSLKKNNIPIIHVSGGDTSLGSKDEYYRNKISSMSFLHFTKTQKQKNKLLKLGINKSKIYVIGSLAIELIKPKNSFQNLKFNSLERKILLNNKPFCLACFHPSTLSKKKNDNNPDHLLNASKKYKNINFVFTASSHDEKGAIILERIKNFCKFNDNCYFIYNLGKKKYFYFLSQCIFMIGNSSSGIIESSLMKKKSINILPRQLGREVDKNVIHCKNNIKQILIKIKKVLDNNKVFYKKSIFDASDKIGKPSNFIFQKIKEINI